MKIDNYSKELEGHSEHSEPCSSDPSILVLSLRLLTINVRYSGELASNRYCRVNLNCINFSFQKSKCLRLMLEGVGTLRVLP